MVSAAHAGLPPLVIRHQALPAIAPCRVALRRRRYASPATATSATHGPLSCAFLQRDVHACERVEAAGSLVVYGNVADGAELVAGGDIMVWGRLCGYAHAGAHGDARTSVSALELRGARLRIAGCESFGRAHVTAPGPHTARLVSAGRHQELQLQPLGPAHPPAAASGLARSLHRWLAWYPAAAAALATGAYAAIAGIALLLAPRTVFGLLFDSSVVPVGWIRVGGVLFATFGAQYACAALIDWRLCRSAAASSMGAPDFPFSLPSSPRSRAVVAAAAAADGPPETQEMRCNLPYESLWHSSIGFYEASVPSRLALAALFAFLVASGQVGAGLLLLAVLNVVGAVSMAIALQRQWEVHVLGDAPKYKSSS